MKLDARDLEILSVLSREGRITNAALARRVGLSASPCWERVRKLEQAGIIEGYGARVALRRLGPALTVFVTIELEDHTAQAFRRFEAHVAALPHVTACWALGGGFDYLMQVVVRDIDAYQALMDSLLEAQVGLARYFTHVVTKPVKGPDPPPLGDILS